jgi:anti-sigma B factor antagonist
MLLQIDKKQIDPDITVLEFTGKISLGRESQRIESMVNELLSQKVSKLIFDLSHVDYIDSAGLGIMTYCYGAMKTAGGTFRLAGATGRVLKLFQFTHLDNHFPFYDSVEAACQDLAS